MKHVCFRSKPGALRRSFLALLTMALVTVAGGRCMALSLVEKSIVDLLRESDAIVVGTVGAVTDGIDERGVPYTEVTLTVSETIRGDVPESYTFRQFGLMNPRLTDDGKRMMMPAPEGLPRYATGEQVLLFLYPRAAWTGLRTTTGLIQGKFVLGPGSAENGTGNVGLFRNVHLDQALAENGEKGMLATASGPVNPETLLGFVRRAVKGRWVEGGRLVGKVR